MTFLYKIFSFVLICPISPNNGDIVLRVFLNLSTLINFSQPPSAELKMWGLWLIDDEGNEADDDTDTDDESDDDEDSDEESGDNSDDSDEDTDDR